MKPKKPWHKACSPPANTDEGVWIFDHDDRDTALDYLYTNIGPEQPREIEPSFFFMLNCLLYSRAETGYPSNHDFYDEDVNMYLTNLLCSFMKPEYHRRAKKYISRYDTNLFSKIENSNDVRLKYTIYKTNADFLLISIGIFQDGSSAEKPTLLKNSEEAHMGRAKAYYEFAYSYSQSMFKKATGITEVLEKLSKGFERYVEILSHMRGEYFNILDRLSKGEVYHLERSIDRIQASKELKAMQDRFLDLYSDYMKSKDPTLKERLQVMVKDIQKLDPSFGFFIED